MQFIVIYFPFGLCLTCSKQIGHLGIKQNHLVSVIKQENPPVARIYLVLWVVFLSGPVKFFWDLKMGDLTGGAKQVSTDPRYQNVSRCGA